MTEFMSPDFLLKTDTAKELYHNFAEGLPIYDFHCHLSPREIAEDKRWDNMTELWLGADHYKWRPCAPTELRSISSPAPPALREV
jgi:glucuronate isomerase